MTVSEIARTTDLDRKTVRRCLRQREWTPYRRAPAGETLLTAHLPWLKERAPQVNYSAQILFQELHASRGYAGGYDTVRNAVRPLRVEAAAASLTQCRFETDPGEQAQADWGQVRIRFDAGPAEVHIFVLTLGYSRRAWAEGYEHERMESLLAAHENGFAHLGGVTREILYDRMRTVIQGDPGGKRHWNPTFKAFAGHWGFEPRVCRPYRAQTKGKVESGVKYVKRNFLPGRTFRDLADFNEQLRAWLTEIADCRRHGTTHEPPIERYARECDALIRLAGRASFLQAMRRERRGGQRLAGGHRHQPLLGAMAVDRQDGRGGARGRVLADQPSRPDRGRACGARRSTSAQRQSGARPRRRRPQRAQALQ